MWHSAGMKSGRQAKQGTRVCVRVSRVWLRVLAVEGGANRSSSQQSVSQSVTVSQSISQSGAVGIGEW